MWSKFKKFVCGISTGVKAVLVFWTLFILFITSLAVFPSGTLIIVVLLAVCSLIALVSALVYAAFSEG